MKISVTMTARDLFQFSLYNSYSGFSGAFNVIFTLGALAILAVTWNWETINVYQRILLVFCALIFTVVQPLMLDRKAKQQAGAIGFSAPLNLTLGDEKIDVEKAGMTGELFWNQVWKVVRGYLIPNRSIEGREQELVEILKKNLPESKRKGLRP